MGKRNRRRKKEKEKEREERDGGREEYVGEKGVREREEKVEGGRGERRKKKERYDEMEGDKVKKLTVNVIVL